MASNDEAKLGTAEYFEKLEADFAKLGYQIRVGDKAPADDEVPAQAVPRFSI